MGMKQIEEAILNGKRNCKLLPKKGGICNVL